MTTVSTKCPECGSLHLSWFCSKFNKSDAVDGRLRMHDVGVKFVLGCDECSETVQVTSCDEIAERLTKEMAAARPADL